MKTALKSALVAALLALSPMPSLAQPPILSAPEMAQALTSGKMVLLDIRSKGEWAETGLALGAWPVSMRTADFKLLLEQILMRHAPDTIALICATGERTAYIVDILEKNGITGVADVSEGMFGNARGPGWIARGLPTISLEEAQKDFAAKMNIN